MNMKELMEPSWKKILTDEFSKDYFESLTHQVEASYVATSTFPSREMIFSAFMRCPFQSVRVVILGQDPYHGAGQAHGLSFSVQDGVRIPPSLKNIYKEISSDTDSLIPESGNLERWADQGVLLLNSTLTVEASKPGSHQKYGWEQFTDAVITTISDQKEHVVFLLWGKFAQAKAVLIDDSKHLILQAPHPSPFSAHTGFFGCGHFSKTNQYLAKHNLVPIVW